MSQLTDWAIATLGSDEDILVPVANTQFSPWLLLPPGPQGEMARSAFEFGLFPKRAEGQGVNFPPSRLSLTHA
jgi:hypothetical protein